MLFSCTLCVHFANFFVHYGPVIIRHQSLLSVKQAMLFFTYCIPNVHFLRGQLLYNDSVELLLALLDEKRAVLKHIQSYLLLLIGDLFAVYEQTALFDGTESLAVARNETELLDKGNKTHSFPFKAGLVHLCRRNIFHISGARKKRF